MAPPTFTSVTPSSGRAGGRYLVSIIGTGFNQAPAAAEDGPTPAPAPYFEVNVTDSAGRTRTATKVYVVSTTQAYALIPPGAPGLASIELVNINEDESRESVTESDAFTYKRPDLAATDRTLIRVVRELLECIAREVHPDVYLTVHTEYAGAPVANFQTIENAKIPAVILVGPRTTENRFYSQNAARVTVPSEGTFVKHATAMTLDLEFEVMAVADKMQHLLALLHELTRFFDRNDFLTIDVDPADATKGTASYEMDFQPNGQFASATDANENNVRQLSGTIVVRGVDVDEDDTTILRGVTLTDVDDVTTTST